MTGQKAIESLFYIVSAFAAGVALYRLNKMNKATQFLCIYLSSGFVSELLASVSAHLFGHNYFIYNIYDFSSFVLIIFYYAHLLYKPSRFSRFLVIFFAIIIFAFLNKSGPYFLSSIHNYDFKFLANLFIITLSLFAIYKMILMKNERLILYQLTHFWVACVFILYNFILLLARSMYYPFNLVTENDNLIFYYIVLFTNIISYLSWILLLLLSPKQYSHEFR